jgi:hypothetical protein
MRPIIRLPILAALPLILTACQTYETTYVERPAVRRTYVVERGYDPYDAPRPIYRDRSYDAYGTTTGRGGPAAGATAMSSPIAGPSRVSSLIAALPRGRTTRIVRPGRQSSFPMPRDVRPSCLTGVSCRPALE